MRPLFALAVVASVLVGCGHPAERPTEPKHVVAGRGSANVSRPLSPGAGSGSAAPVVVAEVGCPTPSCVFHAGTATYFTCLAGGAGACFHFGAACTPPDSCMYDPTDHAYKQCSRPVEGTCAAWGGSCAPASKCMFDPADGLHHHCDAPAGGSCRTWGALCSP